MAKDRVAAARKAADVINKAFARKNSTNKVIITGNDLQAPDRIPTGILSVDYLTGGGFPRGNFSMLWGPEGSGKTSLALLNIAKAQQMDPDFVTIWLDASQRFTAMLDYARSLGVDLERFFAIQVTTVEEAIEVANRMINEDVVDMVVIDDLAVYSSMKEAYKKGKLGTNKEVTDQTVGAQAAANARFIRVMAPLVARKKVAVVFTQQIRASMEANTHFPDMPGGHALKHILVWSGYMRKGGFADAPSVDSTIAGTKCGFAVVMRVSKMSLDGSQPTGAEVKTQWVTGIGIVPGRDAFCFLDQQGLIKTAGATRKLDPDLVKAITGTSELELTFRSRGLLEEWLGNNYRAIYNYVLNPENLKAHRAQEATVATTLTEDEAEDKDLQDEDLQVTEEEASPDTNTIDE